MESRIYNVNLQSGYNALTYIGISQYDAGVPLQFNVYDGAVAASFPAGTTAKIQGVRPSGVGFDISCTLTDNVVTVDTSTDMTARRASSLSRYGSRLRGWMSGRSTLFF